MIEGFSYSMGGGGCPIFMHAKHKLRMLREEFSALSNVP